MFNINKAAVLANAAVNLPSAVIQSFEKGGGFPWGLIPAGLMAAQGAQQLSAIRSTSFGGGGSVAQVSGGGGGGGTQTITPRPQVPNDVLELPTSAATAPEETVVRTEAVINVQSGLYDDGAVIDLIGKINELSLDGLQVRATVVN